MDSALALVIIIVSMVIAIAVVALKYFSLAS